MILWRCSNDSSSKNAKSSACKLSHYRRLRLRYEHEGREGNLERECVRGLLLVSEHVVTGRKVLDHVTFATVCIYVRAQCPLHLCIRAHVCTCVRTNIADHHSHVHIIT
jgi:hypothetical protein